MIRRLKLKISIIALVPIFMIINLLLKNFPEFVEIYYSTSINKIIRQGLSFVTAPFPTSVAEIVVILLLIFLFLLLGRLIIDIRKGKGFNNILTIISYLSALYIVFMIFWGFNYNRLSFDKIAGLKIEPSSKEQLYSLCESLITRANNLRKFVKEDSQGVMDISGGYKDVFSRIYKGYEKVAQVYPELGGKYGPPKRILLSSKMSYTGITGIYMPYTGEPNVNINTTDLMLPNITAHEMAHQRGFAREDEANYIAYLVCAYHPDVDFQYSAVILALIYSMNALAKSDIEDYKKLHAKYSEAVKRDLKNEVEFWSKYEGKIEKVSTNINNTYLKSNGQKDGVQSYGRMVDLLLAEYKSKL